MKIETLLSKAKMTHGDYYDYSKVVYTFAGDKVTIICPKHGEFEQRLYAHINGHKCKKCELESKSKLYRLPLKEFIDRANVIHDGKYDYSKVNFTNNKDRIVIICPSHGEFEQILSGHLTGYGCRKCGIEKKFVTNEDFIRRSNLKHKGYYDYTKAHYTDGRNKVTIICPKHGEFEQIAAGHMSGSECLRCSIEARYLTCEEFIEKSKIIHGEVYDYTNVVYKGTRVKVTITCSEHGDFLQIPNSHLNGAGCPICGVDSFRMSQEEFLNKSKLIHGDRYDYSKVVYKSTSDPVIIVCADHGEFEQSPNTHLTGAGCLKCKWMSSRLTEKEFVKRSITVHGNLYDYSKLKYATIRKKVVIICPKHGEFEQIPTVHLRGSGCSKCRTSKGELAIEEILNRNQIKYVREYCIPEIISRYRYDFYLPEYRILIEFHGIQHYESVGFFGGDAVFEYTKRNDRFKRDFARQFKYRLIEINYKQLDSLSEDEFEKLILKNLAIYGRH